MYYPDMHNWNPVNMTDEEIAARVGAAERLKPLLDDVDPPQSSDNARIWDAIVAASGGRSESSD